jgi:hypothetical protein
MKVAEFKSLSVVSGPNGLRTATAAQTRAVARSVEGRSSSRLSANSGFRRWMKGNTAQVTLQTAFVGIARKANDLFKNSRLGAVGVAGSAEGVGEGLGVSPALVERTHGKQ